MHSARNTLALHSTPVGPSPGPSPVGRGVICEVTPIGLLVSCVESLIFHAGNFYLSQNSQIEQTSLRTVSNSQNAFGIQISQNVSAIVDAEQGATRSLHPAHRGISVITPLPLGEGKGEGPLLALNAVCSVHLCLSVRKRIIVRLAGKVFLSQSAQSSRRFLAHISSPQNASGIQSSQSVTAKDGCWVIGVGC